MSWLYDGILILGLAVCLLYERLFLRKKRSDLKERLGLASYKYPVPKDKKVYWIHAVSVGETKSASAMISQIKKEDNNAFIILSSMTETGHEEAKKNREADVKVFLPWDISFAVKRALNWARPKVVIFVETDFWYHFMHFSKKMGAKVFLVSGKISEKSAKRYRLFPKIFSYFDRIIVQNALYQERFASLMQRPIWIGGNLKYSLPAKKPSQEELDRQKEKWKLSSFTITIASTHDQEERLLLESLLPLWHKWPHLKILLAPRHPERFPLVKKVLEEKQIQYVSFQEEAKEDTQVILIDTMGLLSLCFSLSDLAIVAGSFTGKVGGHNILEPVFLDVPVLFGPHMFSQVEMKEKVLEKKCGQESSLDSLYDNVVQILSDVRYRDAMKKNCHLLSKEMSNSAEETWNLMFDG